MRLADLAPGLLAAAMLSLPAVAQDLFLGETADGGLVSALRDCALEKEIGVAMECRFDLNFPCVDRGVNDDICMLREAAAWDIVMAEALSGAQARAGQADALAESQSGPATAAAQLLESQTLFEAYRAADCPARAQPHAPAANAARIYNLCLIDMTALRVMVLDHWARK
ncbi:MAG: DUF1311 domain-containing protein [Rhodobacter sp.]|nr:DUF1311 domain-containing protein [Rhodobacter sp.]